MKKRNLVILVFSALIIVWSIFQFISLSRSYSGKFTIYPVGKALKVDYKLSELSEEEFTDREQLDQVKDWLLLGILFNSGLDTADINKITYDMPTVRYGYMKHISNLEYGETRSRFIGDGEIVALLPHCSKEEYQDYLAHIADEHRKNLDEIPKRLYVFQYEINLDNNMALITRQDDQDGKVLFTEDCGYIEKKINALESLKEFMGRVDDLTFVRIDSDKKLVVGGRKIKSRPYGKITVEDIAAIYQAELSLEPERKKLKRDLQYVESLLENRLTEEDRDELKKAREYLENNIKEFGIGFSLDPIYDCNAIANLIEGKYDLMLKRIGDNNPDIKSKRLKVETTSLSNLDISMRFDKLFTKYGFKTSDIVKGLRDNKEDKEGPLFEFLLKYKSDNNDHANVFLEIINEIRFQKARYDGNLQGTEVGMHLFYTDLLLKLWLSNRFNSSPEEQIPGFMNNTIVPMAIVFKEENDEFSQNRAWLGPNESKFQFADNKTKILFDRNISEVFAKSANPFIPKNEVTVSTFWSVSINWFNNHFEEVAKYEVEYERLNEILKWSVVTNWLNSENKGNLLSFLRAVKVKRENWFPDWVKNKIKLRFSQWDLINFYPKNYMGIKTETMPLLKSPSYIMFGEEQIISGGVSLARNARIKELSSLVKTGDKLFKRSTLKYGSFPNELKPLDGITSLKSLEGNFYRIKNLKNDFRVLSDLKEGVKLRNKFSEIANTTFERVIAKESNLIRMKSAQNGIDIGELQVFSSKNGFKVGFKAREIDTGQALARKLSDSPDVVSFLCRNNNVERFIALENPNQYLVKTTGSIKWMQIEVGAKPEMNLKGPWQSRVSGNFNDSKICNLKWLDEGAAYKNLKSDYIGINKGGGIRELSVQNYRQLKIEPYKIRTGNNSIINAKRNPITCEIYISKNEFLKHPDELLNINKSSFIKEFEKSTMEIKQVTSRIIDGANPIKLKAELLENFQKQIKYVDDLIDGKEFSRAIEKIDDLISINGPRPELLLKKGITQIKESMFQFSHRSYNKATHLLNDAVAGNPAIKNGTTFYDEINTIISKSTSIPERQGKIIKDFIEFYSHPDIKVVPAKINKIPMGMKVTVKDFSGLKGNKRLIIQDNPSLSNFEWNANIERSLPKILESHPDAILIKIPEKDLGLYRLKLNNITTAYTIPKYKFNPTRDLPYVPFYINTNNADSGDLDDDNDKKIKQNLFILYIPENQ